MPVPIGQIGPNMARYTFGGSASDWTFATYTSGGRTYPVLKSATLTFWDAETGGTQQTVTLNGTATQTVAVGTDGLVPDFLGPEGMTSLWADAGAGRVRMTTSDPLGALSPVAESGSYLDLVNKPTIPATAADVNADTAGAAFAVQQSLNTHKSDTTNPHGVTAAQVGLGNVNNTSDANKPVSTAQATALAAKGDKWQPNTAYAAGVTVQAPGGETVVCTTAHTSGSSYSGTGGPNWALPSVLPATFASGGEVRSKVIVDGTDQTATLQGEINAARAFGAVTLVLPSGTIRIDGTLTLSNDGATPAKQPALVLRGQGAHFSGRGTAVQGGTILDIKGTDTYGKIKTNGLGLLGIQGVTFLDSAGTTTPFIYTTNTTLLIDACAFVGSKTTTACNQDAVILGGPNQVEGGNGWTDGFQGYGTVISRNFFSGIRRAVTGQAFANGVVVRDNTIWNTCGDPSGAPIVWNGKPSGSGTQRASGCFITGNLIEVVAYKNAISLKSCTGFTIDANNVFDATATTTDIYALDADCVANVVREGYTTPGYNVLNDAGTINQFFPLTQQVVGRIGPMDFFDTNVATKIRRLIINGDPATYSTFQVQPTSATAVGGRLLEFKRSAAESTNPGASIWYMLYDGSITVDATAAGGGNWTGPYAKWTNGGRTWSASGTAAGAAAGFDMNIDSGTGGSYLNLKNYAVRFYDHNSGPLRMRVGAGKDGFDLGASSDVTVQRDANAALAVNAPVKTKATTTAGRPTAASVGAGAQMYDTTLSKPIWSDGTTWRDATGTAV